MTAPHTYKSDAHRLAHPYADETSVWIGEYDEHLAALIAMQRDASVRRSKIAKGLSIEQWNLRSAKISLQFADEWCAYCNEQGAPEPVIVNAEICVTRAENRVKINAEKLEV